MIRNIWLAERLRGDAILNCPTARLLKSYAKMTRGMRP